MRNNLDEIQSAIAAYIDQDSTVANIESDDYTLRLSYINRSQREWAEIWPWQVLYTEYHTMASTSTGNASVVLPNDFRKLQGYVQITHDGATTDPFSEIKPDEKNQYGDTARRVEILGSPRGGYIMYVAGADMVSGASITVPYLRSASSLSTGTDIPDCPNSEYLVQRTIALILESREDPRFPQARADAERILSNMIEFENVPQRGADFDRVKTVEQTKYNFRIGRD